MRYYLKTYTKLFLLSVIFSVVGCTLSEMQPLTAEQSVKARAAERWQALIEGKLETAYTYLTPEYRKLYSLEQYGAGVHGVGLWQKAEVQDVACAENCVVTMQIHVKMPPARWGEAIETSSLLKEQWMRDKDSGDWFYLSSK